MKLTGKEAREIVYEGTDDWEPLDETRRIIDQSRWDVHRIVVVLHKPTGKYFRFLYSEGATEMQDTSAYEDVDEYEPTQVKRVLKSVEVWEPL